MHKILAYTNYLESQKKDGLFRKLTPCSHLDAGRIQIEGRDYLNFSSNDYLGLSQHPLLKERASTYATHYGAGNKASRLVTGNSREFDEIERKLACLKGKSAALLFASGFQANASILQVLFDKKILKEEPLVFSDRLNHASMHFGCNAAGVRQIRYRHLDTDHLAQLLIKHESSDQPKFILTESIFSMDGDVADLSQLAILAKQHKALLICDDAHATGILGEGGAGLCGPADLAIGTFSKALGGFGAFVVGSKLMRDYLINRCAGFIYSTAPPPSVLGAMDAALELIPQMDAEREHVAQLAQIFRDELEVRGLDFGASQTQIVPVILRSAERVLNVSNQMRDAGIWVTPIRPPTVPAGAARLRITFNALHQKSDLDLLISTLDKAVKHI
ncbi:MAG: 8-amino-7-oxononanoate synthase [bacterium]|nr:8-amino-7-oxononanoate synthase [bacterium]